MTPKEIKDVTIICVDTVNYGLAINALKKCLQQVTPARCLLLTDIDLVVDGIEVIKIDAIKSKNEYSRFIMKDLYKYFYTDFVLVVQHDGYILNGDSWIGSFLDYDYIGAKWTYGKGERNVGNGGFSLRSKKLQIALGTDDFIKCTEQEDDAICRLYGEYLEKEHAIKFATEEVTDNFSFELNEPIQKTLGFHGHFHEPFKPHIILQRTDALGDLIMLMPVVDYFHNKGYQVVLNTLPRFMAIFFQHHYHIKHISEMNPKIIPERIINFDGTYEAKPMQPVLQSYFEFAGIMDGKMQNSKLSIAATKDEMLFSKYILIHVDEVGLEYRNEHGVDWSFIVNYYQRLGYQVFQIGRRANKIVAPFLNTPTLQMLMFIIKGCDVLIGIDSSPNHIAVALGVPAVIMAGSVDLTKRYSDFSKIQVVQNECPSGNNRRCYHEIENSTTGKVCEYNEFMPPCCTFTHFQILNAVNKLLPQ